MYSSALVKMVPNNEFSMYCHNRHGPFRDYLDFHFELPRNGFTNGFKFSEKNAST